MLLFKISKYQKYITLIISLIFILSGKAPEKNVFLKGLEYCYTKNYKNAIILFENTIPKKGIEEQILQYNLGKAYIKTKQYHKALKYLSAINTNPLKKYALHYSGIACRELGMTTQASQIFISTINDKNIISIQALFELLKIGKLSPEYFITKYSELKNGLKNYYPNYYFRKILPKNYEQYFNLEISKLFIKNKNLNSSSEYLCKLLKSLKEYSKQALELIEKNNVPITGPKNKYYLSKAYYTHGNIKKALIILNSITPSSDLIEPINNLFYYIYKKMKNPEKALEYLKKSLLTKKKDIKNRINLKLGDYYLSKKNNSEAVKYFNKIITGGKYDNSYLYACSKNANIYSKSGNFKEWAKLIKEMQKIFPASEKTLIESLKFLKLAIEKNQTNYYKKVLDVDKIPFYYYKKLLMNKKIPYDIIINSKLNYYYIETLTYNNYGGICKSLIKYGKEKRQKKLFKESINHYISSYLIKPEKKIKKVIIKLLLNFEIIRNIYNFKYTNLVSDDMKWLQIYAKNMMYDEMYDLYYMLIKNKKQNINHLLTMARIFFDNGFYYFSIKILENYILPKIDRKYILFLPPWFQKMLYPDAHIKLINKYNKNKLPNEFILSVIREESRFNVRAQSPAYARGLLQIIPSTMNMIKKNLKIKSDSDFDIENNIQAGIHYLNIMVKRFNNMKLGLSGYNAGPSNTKKWLNKIKLNDKVLVDIIPYDETRNYVKRISVTYWMYKNIY